MKRCVIATSITSSRSLRWLEPNLTGPEQREWYDRLAMENDNVREALGYACDTGDGERALMLAGTIWRFWWNRGYTEEMPTGMCVPLPSAMTRVRLRALEVCSGAAHIAESRGDTEQARMQLERSVDLFRRLGETRWLILALAHLGGVYRKLGDSERGDNSLNEALALAQQSGDVRGAAVVKANLGYTLLEDGEEERAEPLLTRRLKASARLATSTGQQSALRTWRTSPSAVVTSSTRERISARACGSAVDRRHTQPGRTARDGWCRGICSRRRCHQCTALCWSRGVVQCARLRT